MRSLLKWSCVPALCLTIVGSLFGQESNSIGANIEILKLKWERQVRLPRNFDPSVIPTGQVFTTMEAGTAVPSSIKTDDARRDAAIRSAAVGPVDYFPVAPSRIPAHYLYSLTIRNTGTKIIEAVAWNYVFVDPTSHAIVGDHYFLSYAMGKPAKNLTLKGWQRNPPTRVLSVTIAENNKKDSKPLEHAVIQCVLYEDQTTWRNPAARDGVCDLLKKNALMARSRSRKRPKASNSVDSH